MFSSKKLTISVLALSLLATAPVMAKKPTTFLGKIGASIMQTMAKHPILTGAALIGANIKLLPLTPPKENEIPVRHIIAVVGALMVEETFFNALAHNFEIDPL